MSETKSFSAEQILEMCKTFSQAQAEADADHAGWQAELTLTPRMVAQILDANEEI